MSIARIKGGSGCAGVLLCVLIATHISYMLLGFFDRMTTKARTHSCEHFGREGFRLA